MKPNIDRILNVDSEVKFQFQIVDKMFKPEEYVIYATVVNTTDIFGYDDNYYKVITIDKYGDVKKYLKWLTDSEWFQSYMN